MADVCTPPWVPSPLPCPPGGIRHWRAQIRVREAAVPASIPFVFAYTDPQQDFDVSYHMDSTGVLEAGISLVGAGAGEWRGPKRDM